MMEEVDLNENRTVGADSDAIHPASETEGDADRRSRGAGAGSASSTLSDGAAVHTGGRKRPSFRLPQRSLKHYLTKEVLPHMDNYRNRMSFIRGTFLYT